MDNVDKLVALIEKNKTKSVGEIRQTLCDIEYDINRLMYKFLIMHFFVRDNILNYILLNLDLYDRNEIILNNFEEMCIDMFHVLNDDFQEQYFLPTFMKDILYSALEEQNLIVKENLRVEEEKIVTDIMVMKTANSAVN